MANKGSKRTPSKTPKRRNGDSSLETTNEHERNKDFLSEQEVEMLRKEARAGRYGERDDCLVLMLYRHGLRATEAAELRIKDLDLKTSRLWVGRLKGSLSTHQPIEGDELRVIKRYLATRDDDLPWLFITERGGQLTRSGIYRMITRIAERAGLEDVHPPRSDTRAATTWPRRTPANVSSKITLGIATQGTQCATRASPVRTLVEARSVR